MVDEPLQQVVAAMRGRARPIDVAHDAAACNRQPYMDDASMHDTTLTWFEARDGPAAAAGRRSASLCARPITAAMFRSPRPSATSIACRSARTERSRYLKARKLTCKSHAGRVLRGRGRGTPRGTQGRCSGSEAARKVLAIEVAPAAHAAVVHLRGAGVSRRER